MTVDVQPRIGAQLYALLPEVYRARDTSGDLAKYLASSGDLLDRVYATLRQRLDDHFPETCQEWLLPYFAELLDVALKSPEPEGRRAEVARAIAWRQRKGTAVCTEEIAEAVGAMEVELQEGWRRVARTARVGEKLLPSALLDGTPEPDPTDPQTASQHPDLPVVTVDFRRRSRAVRALEPSLVTHRTRFPKVADPVLWRQANPHGVPCFPGSYEDRSMRTVDFRTPDWSSGHFHPQRLLAFVPPPSGFFPPGAPDFAWADIQDAIDARLVERTVAAGRTTYRRTSAQPATIRIHGAVTLNELPPEAEPAPGDEPHVYRFEGFYFADALSVDGSRLELERCAVSSAIVQGAAADAVALSAVDCLFGAVQVESGLTQLECCTVLAETHCTALRAVDCLFPGAVVAGEILCLRYVRVPQELLDSLESRPQELTRVQRYTTDMPVFFSTELGSAGAGVLHPATPASISAGAEDGGELGACHHLHLTLRASAVLEKLAEFLPFGMEPVLIPDKRLKCAPPTPRTRS